MVVRQKSIRVSVIVWAVPSRRGDIFAPARKRGRPNKLAAKQKRQVFRWINGKDPRQYGFDFGLWTRQIVAELDWRD